jgi:hypothetical protein
VSSLSPLLLVRDEDGIWRPARFVFGAIGETMEELSPARRVNRRQMVEEYSPPKTNRRARIAE